MTNGTVNVKGTLSTSEALNLGQGATLTGDGVVLGEVKNIGGVIAPGDPNVLTFGGSLTNSGTIRLQIDGIAGAGVANGYDQLAVNGLASLGGQLDVVFGNGYLPTFGDSFYLVRAGSFSGAFSSVTTKLPSSYAFQFDATGHGMVVPVPEPASLAVLGIGALSLLRRRLKLR